MSFLEWRSEFDSWSGEYTRNYSLLCYGRQGFLLNLSFVLLFLVLQMSFLERDLYDLKS